MILLDYVENVIIIMTEIKKKKIGVLLICLNAHYWPYCKQLVESANKFLLKNHDVEYLLWSDMPDTDYGCTLFPVEPMEWPMPTLLRYHTFLQQEEKLREYDYLFYCDIDMLFVDHVGDELLGDGLTAIGHPMYWLRKTYIAPFEPNPLSAAYIPLPQHYYCGGIQGGKTEDFIKAMWTMRRMIDKDFAINYIARWNDESHWNRYLFDNPPVISLDPSYCCPDSLIKEYYEKVWGQEFKPKLITITKKHSLTKEGGESLRDLLKTL